MSIVGDYWESIVDEKDKKIKELEQEIKFLQEENMSLHMQLGRLHKQYFGACSMDCKGEDD